MPKELTWDDPEDIGILLSEKHPETDPLAVRFTDLHRLVIELPEGALLLSSIALEDGKLARDERRGGYESE